MNKNLINNHDYKALAHTITKEYKWICPYCYQRFKTNIELIAHLESFGLVIHANDRINEKVETENNE